MDACRLSESDKHKLDALYCAPQYSSASVSARSAASCSKIQPPPLYARDAFEAMDVHEERQRVESPPWLRFLCQHRAFFANCAMRWPCGNGFRYEKFIFAMQQPQVVCFAKLTDANSFHRDDRGDDASECLLTWARCFRLDYMALSFTDDGGFGGGLALEILPDCFIQQGGLIVSDSSWASLDDVKDWLGDAGADADGERPHAVPPAPKGPQPWVEHPWLLDFLQPGDPVDDPDPKTGANPRSSARAHDDHGSSSDEDDDTLDAHDVMDLLYAHRDMWAAAAPVEARDFFVFLRGGLDTARRLGVAFDVWRAEAARGEPAAFAVRWGLGKTSDFTIAAYGDEIAHMMAKAWTHKMNFFYQLWLAHDSLEEFVWEAELLALYEEPAAVAEAYASASVRLKHRIQILRDMLPSA
jgi:hypothetical protein